MTFIYGKQGNKEYFGFKIPYMRGQYVKTFTFNNKGIVPFGVYSKKFIKEYVGDYFVCKRSLISLVKTINNPRKYEIFYILFCELRGILWR